jgi:phosphatidylglycerol:prolipoprotein diacylglycerol transferase
MHPVLFDLHLGRFGVFSIGTYGLFYALGFLLALRLAMSYARREGLDPARIVDLGIVALLSGFVGAKLLLYLIDFRTYLADPMAMLRNLRSAGVFYGGFGLACLAVYRYVRKHDLPLGKVADLAAPPLALGQAIGRIGCFMAGCCYGKTCDLPWAVTFSDPRAYELTGVTLGVPLHPTQLYHVMADLLILGITVWFMKRRRFAGQVFWIYVLSYALLRFLVEFYRGDSVRGLFFGASLSTSQLIALPAALAAALVLYLLPRWRGGGAQATRRPTRG